MAVLTPEEVQLFVQDRAENNHLLSGTEFSATAIRLSMDLAVDSFNSLPPKSGATLSDFPSKALLLYGTLWHLYSGQAALLARNTFEYNDGGVQIPIEERFQLYQALSGMYQANFYEAAKSIKLQSNIDEGWGSVRSDYAVLPIW